MGPCLAKARSPGEDPKYITRGTIYVNGSTTETVGEILQSPELKIFNFAELKAATMDFSQENILASGGFGKMYKGWIDTESLKAASPDKGMIVAVKIFNQNGSQGLQEWVAEVKYLGQLSHPNIVKLIGYCTEKDNWLLVYEYMPNHSLKNHIFPSAYSASNNQPLSWDLRIKVALGAARGLTFLHDQANVIFRDFNTSAISLDRNFDAKLACFGLAKDGPIDGKTHVTTRVMGTEWYLAPEYSITGHLTKRGDVYSFGVVFLEMLTGRRAMETDKESPERSLVEWATPYLKNKRRIFGVLDPCLKGKSCDMQKAAELAMQCLSSEPKQRPIMEEVVKALEELHHNIVPVKAKLER
ncbi:Protein kinase APK1B, chloroplast precursor, putative [Ricinus communis]|uniref:non-specific serine/threonine protein kinase n=2 Tax=Ricinus communis TaxID=3988 RepID=B9T048_RICCO|nr:Protein kinase APK1B, chloroplast precursor, putative [Ricinus communis]